MSDRKHWQRVATGDTGSWRSLERSFSMPVQVISMLAMQVMVDLVMDLLDRIASEAASILNFLKWKAGRP